MKRLLTYFKGYGKEAILAPLFKMLEALFELMIPLTVTQIIDVGIANGDRRTVFHMCGIMLLLGVIGLICAVSAQYFSAKAAVGISTKLRSDLFAHIQSFSHSVTDRIGTSTLITRMTGDINAIQTGINMFLRLFMRSPFVVFGSMIMAFLVSPKLALIFVGIIIILGIVVFGIMLISIPLHKKSQASLDQTLSHVRTSYNGTRVVRAFHRENACVDEFDEKHRDLTKIQIFAGKISALLNPLTYALINFAVILLIQKGAIAVNSGVLSQGEVVELYNHMSQILVELIKLAALIITLNKAAASASRVSTIFDIKGEDELKQYHQASAGTNETAVCFDRVSFRYHKTGDEVLSNLSFSVRPGQTVGIIGGTGSGKSTVANLLPGFYYPTEGHIFINGKETSAYSPKELSHMFGIVPQKAVLFRGTIRSNLLWGREDATDEELWHALELACAKEFVEKKEGKLDEPVQQGGSNFSGGQRQRLTIARGLIRKPPFLIFDDSASALDFATESQLRRNLRALDYNPTVFIISQRASSLLHADQIIVLDDGEPVGIGSHEELMSSCEIYREIYHSQFSEKARTEE